ncbi:MAG: fucose isomerase [Clostridiales bacterium]|jgi:L-fucose mutarotase|nr:fucose isomerase [Clostridiales bacterium]
MLKNIPPILSPELLKTLCEMGHGDRIVLADGNFPAASIAAGGGRLIRCDGHGIPELLRAILVLFPLDTYVDQPVGLMAVTPGDPVETPIWDKYYTLIADADPRGRDAVRAVERFAFYAEARAAYAVVATGESALYANMILQKGVVMPSGGAQYGG